LNNILGRYNAKPLIHKWQKTNEVIVNYSSSPHIKKCDKLSHLPAIFVTSPWQLSVYQECRYRGLPAFFETLLKDALLSTSFKQFLKKIHLPLLAQTMLDSDFLNQGNQHHLRHRNL